MGSSVHVGLAQSYPSGSLITFSGRVSGWCGASEIEPYVRRRGMEQFAMEGLINCVAYAGDGQRLGQGDIEELSEILKFPGQFIWIGLYEPDEELLREVQQEFNLHDLAIEDAHAAHQRPKLEEYGDSLFVVLRTAQRVEGEIRFGETHIFVGPR